MPRIDDEFLLLSRQGRVGPGFHARMRREHAAAQLKTSDPDAYAAAVLRAPGRRWPVQRRFAVRRGLAAVIAAARRQVL